MVLVMETKTPGILVAHPRPQHRRHRTATPADGIVQTRRARCIRRPLPARWHQRRLTNVWCGVRPCSDSSGARGRSPSVPVLGWGAGCAGGSYTCNPRPAHHSGRLVVSCRSAWKSTEPTHDGSPHSNGAITMYIHTLDTTNTVTTGHSEGPTPPAFRTTSGHSRPPIGADLGGWLGR